MSYDHDRQVLSRAGTRFEGVFGIETVERRLQESYDLLAATSKIPDYLPLLAERFTVDRLHLLAKTGPTESQ